MGLGETSPGGANRVKRGGSWNNNARNCRSANRNNNHPDNRNNNLGFRLACGAEHTKMPDLMCSRIHQACFLCSDASPAPG